MTRFLFAASLLLAALAPARAQRLESQTAPYKAGQRVALRLRVAGTIRVRAGDEIRVTAHVSLNDNQQNEAYALVLENTPDELLVTEKLDRVMLRQANYQGICHGTRYNTGNHSPGQDYSYCAKIDYDVTLPASVELFVNATEANLQVQDLTGSVYLATSGGNISLSGLRGPVVAKTTSGYVTVDSPGTAPLTATSLYGDVEVSWPTNQNASLTLKSVSGEAKTEPAPIPGSPQPVRYVGRELQANYGTGTGNAQLVKLQSTSGNVVFRQVK